MNFLTRIFGSRNDRLIKQYRKQVERINALEASVSALTDEQLVGKTAEFKTRVANGETLDALLPEAFAVCREASKRVLGMRHFDVQMIGGMVLHDGKIAEMRTGEGKTLMATLPAYLNALSGKGVHVVTVNDYLASRDAAWMGRLYRFLGLEVGVILSQQATEEKRTAYAADITYGTNNEYGFDYLRDNMEYTAADRRQRTLNFAIVDEVDSILIDEARTPLIISGQAEDHTELYVGMNQVPALLSEMAHEPRPQEAEPPGDYWVDRKAHQVHMSEAGHEKAERILAERGLLPNGASLYDPSNILVMHHLMVALRSHTLYQRDVHYVVQQGEVVIVDEFTGRLMAGRRWSDGLHQGVEAKEGVAIQAENQTLASITFQNFFRMYGRLSGMTGTADTEAYEFQEIYGLETVVIPTHRAMVRKDKQDQVFRTAEEKHDAIIADIKECQLRGQPVLVGTTSIENSELLAGILAAQKIPHNVLNAKQHAREAEIVMNAGAPGVVTIATNMAGRGTDIVLGGSISRELDLIREDESLSATEKDIRSSKVKADWQVLHDQVLASGGLHIIGTERHESRRIDNQLRGRSGRQGDPGSSRFYLSMDDQLLKIFAGDRLKSIMDRLKLPKGEPIEAGMVTRSIESAQRKVEARNFDIRKQLLEYDDVANDQRKVIYKQRNDLLDAKDISGQVRDLRHGVLTDLVREHVPLETSEEQWDLPALESALRSDWQMEIPLAQMAKADDSFDGDAMVKLVCEASDKIIQDKIDQIGSVEPWANFERSVMLQTVDNQWREHLASLDHLRQGIHLRGFAQKNPKQEYKREAFELFERLLHNIRHDVSSALVNVRIQSAEQVEEAVQAPAPAYSNVQYTHEEFDEAATDDAQATQSQAAPSHEGNAELSDDPAAQPFKRFGDKIGRNDPCPCGSGKKFKQCHGKLA
jgi:preprotein translocase subunit SecA